MNTHLESYLTLTDNSKLMYTGFNYEIYECISTKKKLWDIILDDRGMHTTATRNINSVQ